MSRFLVPTRWRLFSLLFLLSFLSYLMRQNIHVAGEFMMPELGISEIEMGGFMPPSSGDMPSVNCRAASLASCWGPAGAELRGVVW